MRTPRFPNVPVRLAALALAVLSMLVPSRAKAQVDFSRFVEIGDSLTAGYLDGCWVETGQRDSFGAILARQAGAASFEQPLLRSPGLGSGVGPGRGCLSLTAILPAPAFTRLESVLAPLNLNLARPYNNLGVPGYRISDVTDARTAADNGNPLTDIVLRNRPGNPATTVLQQAAGLAPTFVTIFIGNNDVLGAAGAGTAIEGATLTPMSVLTPRLNTILSAVKTAQGGTAMGVVMTLPDVTAIPFVRAISPIITSGGRPVIDPVRGLPYTALSQKVLKDLTIPTGQLGAIAPIPSDSLLTLNAASLLASGVGVPCEALNVAGAPANDPRRANCGKPLPDDANPQTGAPGVVLYPDEIASIRARTLQINELLRSAAAAAGFKLFDTNALFADLALNGRSYIGIPITTSFLSGGFFSYDGVHPTSLGYAIFAIELIHFINANFGASIPDPNLATFLFSGSSTGGSSLTGTLPLGLGPLSPDEVLSSASEIYSAENWKTLRWIFGETRLLAVGEPPEADGPAPSPRDGRGRER